MASVKNAKPSKEKGIPMIAPACSMNPGQSKPSSNESTVPETAPPANKMAVPFAHRLQRLRYTGCFVRRYIPSAMAIISGIPIPNAAKTMWKASDIAICERAKRKSLIPSQRDRFQVLINYPSSYWIQRRIRLINSRISGFRISTPGWADYKWENGACKHDSRNDFERLCVVARTLADV